MKKTTQNTFVYPQYIPNDKRYLWGLTTTHLIIVLLIGMMPIFTMNFIYISMGLGMALFLSYFFRKDKGSRLSTGENYMITLRSLFTPSNILRRGRGSSKKKMKTAQDYVPIKDFYDNYLELEDGTKRLYLRILSAGLNIASSQELLSLIYSNAQFMEVNRYPFEIFCQDASVRLDHITSKYEMMIENERSEISKGDLKEQLSQIKASKSELRTQKSYYLIVELRGDVSIERIEKQLINTLIDNEMDAVSVSRDELKDLVGTYYTGRHFDTYPDTELDVTPELRASLERKKKLSYAEAQKLGIWTYQDYITPLHASFRSDLVKWGDRFVKHYGISGYVLTTEKMPLLERIANMQGVTTHIFYEKIDFRTFKNQWNQHQKIDFATAQEVSDSIEYEINTDAVKEVYKSITRGEEEMLYVSVYHQLSARDLTSLEDLILKFENELSKSGLVAEAIESRYLNEMAFKTLSPLGKNFLENQFKQNMPSKSAANLYPFNQFGLVDPNGFFLGHETPSRKTDDDTGAVIVDFTRKNTPDRSNYNILINGMSGEGKTVLQMGILFNFMINKTYVDFIDIEGTYSEFFKRRGGITIDMSGNSDYAINILQPRLIKGVTTTIDDHFGVVINWLRTLKPDWSTEQYDAFKIFLRKTYKEAGIDKNTELTRLKNEEYPRLSDVYRILKDAKSNPSIAEVVSMEIIDSLILGLHDTVEGRGEAKLFDRHTNIPAINSVPAVNYDLSTLNGSGSDTVFIAQLVNMFSYLKTNVKNTLPGQHYVLGMDEFHFMLKEKFAYAVNEFEIAERTLRKWDGTLMLGTQTSDELTESREEYKVFFSQPTYKFFFHQGEIDYKKFKDFMRMTDAEIEKLRVPRKGKCIFKYGTSKMDLSVAMPSWFKEVKIDVH